VTNDAKRLNRLLRYRRGNHIPAEERNRGAEADHSQREKYKPFEALLTAVLAGG